MSLNRREIEEELDNDYVPEEDQLELDLEEDDQEEVTEQYPEDWYIGFPNGERL